MRIVKMTEHEFKKETEIHDFFTKCLPKRNPPGKFRMLCTSDKAKPKIGKNGLREGEKLIFTFKNKIIWIGEADSGRCPNIKDERSVDLKKYPFYFVLKMGKNKPRKAKENSKLIDFENELRVIYPDLKNLAKSHGWPKIDTESEKDQLKKKKLEKLFDKLVK